MSRRTGGIDRTAAGGDAVARGARRPPGACGVVLLFVLQFVVLGGPTGCATAPPTGPAAPVEVAVDVAESDRPFLVPPASGYGEPLPPEVVEVLSRGHRSILDGRVAEARRAAAEASTALPGEPVPPPATVLAAQADLLAGDHARAVEATEPLATERPAYVAAQLVLGRAHERLGDPVAAFAAYHAIADLAEPAAAQVATLRPRVVDLLSGRIDEALRAGDPDEAAELLGRMQLWAPAEAATVRAGWRVARARGDRQGELLALRELFDRHGPVSEREIVERRATLELGVGDPGAGVQLFEDLVRDHPEDSSLAERLASAKFLWRVTQLPPQVADAAAMAEVDRGGFAVLLYWLVPQVRYGGGGTARIASDILDDPRREEIARVVNLGLLDVDATVHRFYPHNPLRRSHGLGALVELVLRSGAACAGGLSREPAGDTTCAVAVRCGLVADGSACTASDGLSGSEALEMLRRAQDVLGGR